MTVKKYFRLSITCLLIVASHLSFSQKRKADSLEKILSEKPEIKKRIELLCRLSAEYLARGDEKRALDSASSALALSETIAYRNGTIDATNRIGDYYETVSRYDKSIEYYEEALRLARIEKDNDGISLNLNDLGTTCRKMGNYNRSLTCFLEALQITEKDKDKNSESAVLNNLGVTYFYLKEPHKTLAAFQRSIAIREEMGDKLGIATGCGNISNVYLSVGNTEKAVESVNRALAIYQELGVKRGVAACEQTLGMMYHNNKEYDLALKHYYSSLAIRKEFDDIHAAATLQSDIASTLSRQGKYKEAEESFFAALKVFREIKGDDYIKDTYFNLSDNYFSSKDYLNAYKYQKMYSMMNDSIFSKESSKQMSELQAKYETEKKENEIKILTAEKQVQDLAFNKQKQQKNFLMVGVFLVLILVLVVFNRYQIKTKAHSLLEKQNGIIAQKNKDITDSINYAKRIQDSMLPSLSNITKAFPSSFVLYKPKDIVSGDFYWFTQHDGLTFIAAVDCTGHGVPGAIMSMVGNDKLNYAVIEKKRSNPSEVLMQLNQSVKESLQQNQFTDGSATNDGMDIAFCAFDLSNCKLSFAGANRPLYMVRNGEIKELTATKASIGGSTSSQQLFPSNILDVQKGDMVYLFSDGYPDQFGGEQGKKLMTRRFKEILLSIHEHPPEKQQVILESKFNEWKGSLEQVDDVLVIGIKV